MDKSELGEDFIFGKVEKWDSVAHLNLISELEDTFDTMLETEDILHYGSYLNGLEILKETEWKSEEGWAKWRDFSNIKSV